MESYEVGLDTLVRSSAKSDEPYKNSMTNSVVADPNVLDALVEVQVVCKENGSLVTIVHGHETLYFKIELLN